MTWFFAVLIVLVMGGVAAVAAGKGGSLGPAYDDLPDVRLPAEGPLTAEHLREIRFSTAVRGYRADEVDALLERLARQLEPPRESRREPARETPRDSETPDTSV